MSDIEVGEELVRTKLMAPILPGPFVVRNRLHDALDAAVDRQVRLLLVTAPAGSGKSTLLAGWLADRAEPAAWLQVEASESDPARFWSYVVASIGMIHPTVEQAVRPLVAGASADATGVVTALANALTELEERLFLVVDDYHLIDSKRVHTSFERLIELCPTSLTVVIGSRVDPPFRLGRLRVRGQLTELRAEDLRFDSSEAGPLLGARSAEVDDDALSRLLAQTEGWAAGLVLAGVSMESANDIEGFVDGFHGSDRLVVDYLSDEFLSSVSDDDRQRLLQTSILQRLTGSLVDVVCDRPGGDAWLRRISATNQLVIGLDRSGKWFRYHHLLGDLLALEAGQSIPVELAGLHLRAATWHAAHGSARRAVAHFVEGGDLATAADLIWDHATELLTDGQLQTVVDQLDRLGPLAEEHTGALLVRGWIALMTGWFAEAERCLDRARDREPNREQSGIIVALAIMIHQAHGDIGAALAEAERSGPPVDATQAMTLGVAMVGAGRFDEARTHLRLAREMAATEPDAFVAAVAPISEAVAELESGDSGSARRLAEEALDSAAASRFDEAPQMALAHSVVARTSTDDLDAAVAARRGVELARRSPEAIMLAYALASAADVLCSQNDTEGDALLTEARSTIDRCPDSGVAGVYLATVEARHGRPVAAPSAQPLVEELTDREFAVLRLLPSQLSQRDIASELYVSLNTVKTHCRAIYRKVGVGDRKTAVQAARDLDLL